MEEYFVLSVFLLIFETLAVRTVRKCAASNLLLKQKQQCPLALRSSMVNVSLRAACTDVISLMQASRVASL